MNRFKSLVNFFIITFVYFLVFIFNIKIYANLENINADKKLNIVFFGLPAYGHTNPTLGLVKALTQKGHKVTYFNVKAFKDAIENAGAKFVEYDSKNLAKLGSLDVKTPKNELIEVHKVLIDVIAEMLPKLINNNEKFDAVIYDQIAMWGQAFAEVQNIPSFCSHSTFLFDSNDIKKLMKVSNESIDSEYNAKLQLVTKYFNNKLDSYEDILNIQNCSTATSTITYTSKELQPDSDKFKQDNLLYLGNRYNSHYKPSLVNFSEDSLIYISLGTVVNNKPALLKLIIELLASGKHEVIVSAGNNQDLYNSLTSYMATTNFANKKIHIYKYVDQKDILSKASLFVTHAGFNSIYEGLYFSVPMIMLPQTPEQLFNAMRVQELDAGYYVDVDNISKDSINEAFKQSYSNWLNYKYSVQKIRNSFLSSYDNKKVVELIENIVKDKHN